MKTSQEGRALITKLEGKRATAYRDSAGLLTIGVGHLIRPDEPELRNAHLTDEQIDELLAADLVTAEEGVKRLFPNVKRQNQFDALVSFVFNLGESGVRNGTLDDLINKGATAEAISAKWMEYTYAGGRKVPGLITRRATEVHFYWQHLWRTAVVLLIVASIAMLTAATITATA